MNTEESVGVVIGRFQVSELHKGHRYLIDHVLSRHTHTLVLIGDHSGQPTQKCPLDYPTRALMLKGEYPDIAILRIEDSSSDALWSELVDQIIEHLFPNLNAVLYGSRKSFIPHYSGRFPCVEIAEKSSCNGTVNRARLSENPVDSSLFRQGAIYAVHQYFPTAYGAVDLAIVDRYLGRVLLGRKAHEKLFRFVGGFIDPSDESIEAAAQREGREEAGDIELADITYIRSQKIDDWRYRGSESSVMTSFCVATYVFGVPRAGDDIAEVKWFPFDVFQDELVPEHRALGTLLTEHLTTLPKGGTS